jgi:hypothetical protein
MLKSKVQPVLYVVTIRVTANIRNHQTLRAV